MEKSRSWPSAHDWKSCIPQKGIEGSNPSFSAIINHLLPTNSVKGGFSLFFAVSRKLPNLVEVFLNLGLIIVLK